MNKYLYRLCCCMLIVLSVITGSAVAQQSATSSQKDRFAQAKIFLASFKNDSALFVLEELIVELKEKDELDTPFGIRVQMRQAEALEKDHKDIQALEKLLRLTDVCLAQKYWDVLANTNLSLARLYEKIGRKEDCLVHLRRAESVIKNHSVDSLYPRFAIRISSYHRIYNDRDSSLYYANEAMRTAPKYKQYNEQAVGNLLAGMLLSNKSTNKAIKHYNAAARYWKRTEDYSGYGGMMSNLVSIYTRQGAFKKALIYNDSSIWAAHKAAAMGNDAQYIYFHSYKKRANLYKELGQVDSAWYYINKGFEMQLSDAYQSRHDKIIEIDAQYKDSKKEARIKEQAQQILYEKERRSWLGISATILLFLAGLLGFSYLKLRKAKEKTEFQAATIQETNKELSSSLKRQTALQSEVHHRVKNNLQVIISLLELQMEEADTPKARKSLEEMSNRIYSMASIHQLLYHEEGKDLVNIHEYTANLCRHFTNLSKSGIEPTFDLDIDELEFNLETLMPIGIMLTELLANSIKYANEELKQLKVSIQIKPSGVGYSILYKDNGEGFLDGKSEEGLGPYLLKSMSRQLNGNFTSNQEDGPIVKIFFKSKHN